VFSRPVAYYAISAAAVFTASIDLSSLRIFQVFLVFLFHFSLNQPFLISTILISSFYLILIGATFLALFRIIASISIALLRKFFVPIVFSLRGQPLH
jgi:hypothetical protein